jgi:hypothetical protein
MTAAPVIDNALAGARRMAHMPQPNRATRRVFAFDRMRRLWQCRAGFRVRDTGPKTQVQ